MVVVPADVVDETRSSIRAECPTEVVPGGETRSASVRAGLRLAADSTYVFVHDGARPLATEALFRRVLDALRAGAAGAIPAVAVADTIREIDASAAPLDRSSLRAVQTPQGFRTSVLRAAHESEAEASDDATLVAALGETVELVDGETTNRKITDPEDLAIARAILDSMDSDPTNPELRIGQGFDIHPFSEDADRPMVLGGVTFADAGPGLAGHSDADVIAHAVTDALLGACGMGDIGQHFPDTDPALAGADSIELLRRAVADIRAAGWSPLNADCSVVLDRPKLAPRRSEMQERLSEAVGAPVTVKGKRPEGIGALGRHEGIACWASALVRRT